MLGKGGSKLKFEGKFYNFSLMTPFFTPPHTADPNIPIYIAGLNEHILRLAGETCDGLHAHPFNSPKYLREISCFRNVEQGLKKAGRDRKNFTIAAIAFAIVGHNGRADTRCAKQVRQQISFYASTRTYRSCSKLTDGATCRSPQREGRQRRMGRDGRARSRTRCSSVFCDRNMGRYRGESEKALRWLARSGRVLHAVSSGQESRLSGASSINNSTDNVRGRPHVAPGRRNDQTRTSHICGNPDSRHGRGGLQFIARARQDAAPAAAPINLDRGIERGRAGEENSLVVAEQIGDTKFWLPSTIVVQPGDKVTLTLKNEVPGTAVDARISNCRHINISEIVTRGEKPKVVSLHGRQTGHLSLTTASYIRAMSAGQLLVEPAAGK